MTQEHSNCKVLRWQKMLDLKDPLLGRTFFLLEQVVFSAFLELNKFVGK